MTRVTIVRKPKRRPGRNPIHGFGIAGAAIVLMKRENPPKPKPAMNP
jgi:hypothetical protein